MASHWVWPMVGNRGRLTVGRREDGVFLSHCLPLRVQAPPFAISLSLSLVCVCVCVTGAIKLPSAADSPLFPPPSPHPYKQTFLYSSVLETSQWSSASH